MEVWSDFLVSLLNLQKHLIVMDPSIHQSCSELVFFFPQLDWMCIKLCKFIFERLKFFFHIIFIVHKFLPKVSVFLEFMKILRLRGKVGFGSNKEFMKRFKLMDTSFLKISHEHVLPQNYNLTQGLFERAVIKNDASNWMRWLNLLNLLRLGVGIFDLLSKLTDISPVLVNGFSDKLLFFLIFPKQRRVGPFIFCGIFCHLIADFVEVIEDFLWVFLNVSIIANFIVIVRLKELELFFLKYFSVGVLFLLHSDQNFRPFDLVNVIHFVVNFYESTDYVIYWTDNLGNCFK